jgi:flagellar biosynthesis activator protein FlaF
LNAYDNVNKATMSGRDVEAEVLTKAALKLKACQDNWAENGNSAILEAALKYNQRVWTILQAELEKPGNPLPSALKADLLRLSLFINKRSLETLAYPAPEKLTILININQNIAAGLRMRTSASAPAKAAA